MTLTLDAEAAAELPERDDKGAPTFRANARGGRMSRFFGGGWKRECGSLNENFSRPKP